MAGFWFSLLAISVGAVGIVLARSADSLGAAYKLDRSITGFMLLAAATSLPELIVSCQVASSGSPDMAVGSLLGSCLMNLMILAVIDLMRRTRGRILSRKAASHSLSALASILLAAVVAVAVLNPDWALMKRLHWGSLLVFAAYAFTIRLVFVDRSRSRAADIIESPEVEQQLDSQPSSKWRPLVWYLLSTAGIFALASPLAVTSDQLAVLLGLSGTFFGAVFLALVTSLPEFVTTYEATRINADEMAIGNILGSNAFNLVILVAVDLVTPMPLFSVLGPIHAVAALGIMITTSIAAMGMLYRVEKRLWFLEPDATAVIIASLAFFYLLYQG